MSEDKRGVDAMQLIQALTYRDGCNDTFELKIDGEYGV